MQQLDQDSYNNLNNKSAMWQSQNLQFLPDGYRNCIWRTFLSCFADITAPTKGKKLTIWWPWACRPQSNWSLRTDKVKPSDTTLLPHHQSIRELCTSWLYLLQLLSLIFPLKMLPCNLSVSLKLLHVSCSQLLVWHLLHVCTFFTITWC